MDKRIKVIWKSLFITLLIFGFAILFNNFVDFLRINEIVDVMEEHELGRDVFLTQRSFIDSFSEYGCDALKLRFDSLKKEIRKVGVELSTYSRFSLFKKKDFDYLKRKYFLLELELLTLVQKMNSRCGNPYLTVLFFYEIDDGDSERQGFVLDEVSKKFDENLLVLSIDKDYEDEPLLKLMVNIFDIQTAPTIIIGQKKIEGFVYFDELSTEIKKELSPTDPYGKKKDLDFTVLATGINKSELINDLFLSLENETDFFSRADIFLLLGRLKKNNSLMCSALSELDKINSTNPEEMALIYETIASIDCGRNTGVFYSLAAKEWRKLGKFWRAKIDKALSEGDLPLLEFNISSVEPVLKPGNYSSVTLGKSKIFVNKFSKIVSQVDRVSRDWLSGEIHNPFSKDILHVFSELKSWKKKNIFESIGWHEGGRIRELLSVGAVNFVATGTMVAEKEGIWYAPDEKGVFRFEVPDDKVLYPTTRFLRDNLAVIIDSHGVNMVVDQAVSKNATLVIACGDHPAKAAAAKYLSDKGIDVISFPNKFFYLLLGHNSSVMGSPPMKHYMDQIVFGDRPLTLNLDDKIVVSNSSNNVYALWYYQSPACYFAELQKVIPLDIIYYSFDDFGSQVDLVDVAVRISANVIATRVYNEYDYGALSSWLSANKDRKAILFHSSSYPYGVKMFKEFPEQTSFGDVTPIFKYSKRD